MADLTATPTEAKSIARLEWLLVAIGIVGLLAAPFFLYPIFLMQIMCFALFACAFNLLLGYTGLLSFGHAAFFGGAAYFCAHAVKVWGWPPEAGRSSALRAPSIRARSGVASAAGSRDASKRQIRVGVQVWRR